MEFVQSLLQSSEAAIRYKTAVHVYGMDPAAPPALQLAQEVCHSDLVKTLLSERDESGRIPRHPYAKWDGAHWVLACLADLGYPPGDEQLRPLVEQVLAWLLEPNRLRRIPTIHGRVRRCASQEGNALYSLLILGLSDSRLEQLADYLIRWQWPDGGWNCDRRPQASHASVHESLIPLRALDLYARRTGDPRAAQAAQLAAEVFLQRAMFYRLSDGRVIDPNFTLLHYPSYWHYDMLSGLKVIVETGRITDRRCRPALDMLESKQLPTGGFPAEQKYYHITDHKVSGRSLVDWGPVQKGVANNFVSVDAMYVLKAVGRLQV